MREAAGLQTEKPSKMSPREMAKKDGLVSSSPNTLGQSGRLASSSSATQKLEATKILPETTLP